MERITLHRGIVVVGHNNKLQVKISGAFIELPPLIEPIEFNINDKVIGASIEGKFNIIFKFKLIDAKYYYGYYTKKWIENEFKIQTIKDFNPVTFDPYISNYILGEEIDLNRNQILSVAL